MITRILFLLFSFSFIATAYTQSVEEKITRRRPYGLDIPANAGDLLPQLYMAKSFDSIGAALALMKKHSDEHPVEKFCLTTLHFATNHWSTLLQIEPVRLVLPQSRRKFYPGHS